MWAGDYNTPGLRNLTQIIIHLVWLNVNWWWMYDYVIVHNSYDTSSLLSMNLTQSKIMIILGRRRLQILLSAFGFVFIYSFCPRFWLLHKQSQCWSRQRLICCKIATKKQRLLRILIAIYCSCKSSRGRTCFVARVFQQHVAHCWPTEPQR